VLAGAFGKGRHHQEAKASMARVTHWYQERQRRTWCWSRLWQHLQRHGTHESSPTRQITSASQAADG
jgi:hypothetical protein